MEQKSPDKVCYQFICPRYPKCARARGRGCCIEYPEDEAQMVQEGDCRAEDGFPLFAGEEQVYLGLWRNERNIYLYTKTDMVIFDKVI